MIEVIDTQKTYHSIKMSSNSQHLDAVHWVKVGDTILQSNQLDNLHQKQELVKVLPRSAPSAGAFASSAAEISFDLGSQAIDYIQSIYLNFTITNTGAVAMHPTDGLGFIEYVNVECDGQIVQTLWAQELRRSLLASAPSNSKLNSLLGEMGVSETTYNANAVLAAGLNKKFIAPILSTLFSQCDLPISAQSKNQWRLTFRLMSGSSVLRSTSVSTIADMNVSDVFLVLHGQRSSDRQRQEEMVGLISPSGMRTFRYLNYSRESLSLGATVNGTPQTANVNATGMLAYAHVDLQPSVIPNADGFYTPQNIDSLDLLRNNQIINHTLGDNGFGYAMEKALTHEYWGTTFLHSVKNAHTILFTEQPLKTIEKAVNYGFVRMTGAQETIRCTPRVTLASAQLLLYCAWYSSLEVDFSTGKVVVHRNNTQF